MPSITIGIPFYNCEKYLHNTIRSLFAQSFTDWEAIFVDDGSTDSSLSIVRRVDDDRIRVYSDGVNKGIGARRKQIVDLAKGRYLAWQDADDIMALDRLQIQYEFLENHPDIHFIDSSTYITDDNTNVVSVNVRAEGIVPPAIMAETPQMINSTAMARTEMYRDINFDINSRRVEDWDVWIRASKKYTFYHLDAYLGYHLDADVNQKPRIDRELTEPKWLLRTYLKYGREHLGVAKCILLSLRLCVRTVYRVTIILLGQHKLFKAARTNSLTPERRAIAQLDLDKIMKTQVPGIDC